MKNFFVKCLITFYARRPFHFFYLVLLIIATIITHALGKPRASLICLIVSIALLVYILILSIVCMVYRKEHLRFKVYLSFSVERIPLLAQYISDYLKPAFWLFNIDYYDFREHKQFHHLDWPSICKEIDENLVNSDIFIRFIGHGLEPNKPRLVMNEWENTYIDPYTRSLSGMPDYTNYEVNESYDRFGFNNPVNRFQIVSSAIMVSPMAHIHTIYINPDESALDFALRVINKLSHGYHEQIQLRSRAAFWDEFDRSKESQT